MKQSPFNDAPHESEVRSYSRQWPTQFVRANGSYLESRDKRYLDFFCAAGSLNYGHNDPDAKVALIEYLERNGPLQAMDMDTEARSTFLEDIHRLILQPRNLGDYRVMFTGPTGTNAVEAALKCARKYTGRTEVVSFLRGFHGVTLGSLAATSNTSKRAGGGVPLSNVSRFPFDTQEVDIEDSIGWLEREYFANRPTEELPACVLTETIQGEGGINVARGSWLQALSTLCHNYNTPLIVDDIQMGCGRTGPFFSFEDYGVLPDIITLSKSLSGIGLPLSVVLVKPEMDLTTPGQHNGTFRGNNAAFVTASTCITKFWSDSTLQNKVRNNCEVIRRHLANLELPEECTFRGKGLVWGIDLKSGRKASDITRSCFNAGLLVETAGHDDQVIKIMPPLNISPNDLEEGLGIISDAVMTSLNQTDT